MKPKVYLETSVISYLTARPSRDLIRAARQQITTEWWQGRDRIELYVSQTVIHEAAGGDPDAAARRLSAVDGIPVLELSPAVSELADNLIRQSALPAKAAIDAVHVAVAVVNGIQYLVTWNCTHIANATMRGKIEQTCKDAGYEPTIICTPDQLCEE